MQDPIACNVLSDSLGPFSKSFQDIFVEDVIKLSVLELKILCEQYHGCTANVTEVVKDDRTQTAIAQDRLNRSSLNKYVHASKVITNSPIYINEVLHSQVVHRKISTPTFGTNLM
jgi:hypothetical protein